MPRKDTIEKAKRARREGKSASTQAGEFVREEIHHIREGKHGARNTKQAIAIGLSKARRAGVRLPAPKAGRTSEATRERAEHDVEAGQRRPRKPARKRARATERALKREGRSAASRSALSKQARKSAARRGPEARKDAARKAARTKGPTKRAAAARKAAKTRARKRASA